jgi:hypothetical protein
MVELVLVLLAGVGCAILVELWAESRKPHKGQDGS